jgi:hypothetical protein
MAFQLNVEYRNHPVCCDLTAQEESVYLLCLTNNNTDRSGDYIPEKIVIRKKEKRWVRDMDNTSELANFSIKEMILFEPEK